MPNNPNDNDPKPVPPPPPPPPPPKAPETKPAEAKEPARVTEEGIAYGKYTLIEKIAVGGMAELSSIFILSMRLFTIRTRISPSSVIRPSSLCSSLSQQTVPSPYPGTPLGVMPFPVRRYLMYEASDCTIRGENVISPGSDRAMVQIGG